MRVQLVAGRRDTATDRGCGTVGKRRDGERDRGEQATMLHSRSPFIIEGRTAIESREASMTTAYHLAQLNIATMREPLTSPSMSDFVANLDRINALAEASPGFVWRLKDEAGDATAIRAFGEATVEEAAARLELLRSGGASAAAFTFARPFDPPGPATL